MRDCGSCAHWVKVTSSSGGESYGICEKFDLRCCSDNGKRCRGFERPKHKRVHASIRMAHASAEGDFDA